MALATFTAFVALMNLWLALWGGLPVVAALWGAAAVLWCIAALRGASRYIVRLGFASAVIALLATVAQARWGTCVSGAVAPLVRSQTKLEWVKHRSAKGQIDLVADGWKLIGAYDIDSGIYRRCIDYRRQLWSEPEPLPTDVPLPPGGTIEQVSQNFGVDLDKLHQEEDGYKLGGRPVSKEEAYHAVEKGLPDDAHKMRVTVIGTDEERKKFEQAFRASDLAGSCVLWSVPPDHWSLKDNDSKQTVFKVDGKPTIYAQAPDGKVLWRQDDATNAVENLRKVSKPYDPLKDPGPNSSPLLPDGIPNIPLPLVAVALLLIVAFWKGKQTT
jgi:hypothetical protein